VDKYYCKKILQSYTKKGIGSFKFYKKKEAKMMTLDLELEEALIQTLSFLSSEHRVIYSLEEREYMLQMFLDLNLPDGQKKFLALSLFMRGQMLMICSPLNVYFFRLEHPNEPLTFSGLVHQWVEDHSPDKKASPAKRYRQRDLVPPN